MCGNTRAAQESGPCASRWKTFAAYAATRIRGAILDELRRQDPMSRWSRAKAKRLGLAISRLEQEQDANYSQDSLCVEINMSEEELVGLMEEVRPVMVISLDEVDPRPDFRDDSLHNIIPDDCCVSALDALERKEIISLLVERIAQLPSRHSRTGVI
jgi:RNA polymerase sigma factor for flagellar operon FliA